MKDFFKVIGIGIAGMIIAAVYLGFFCGEEWCTSFSVSKIRKAVDFASCQELGFSVSRTHPSRCSAGVKMFLQDDSSPLRVFLPKDDASLGLPLVIEGEVMTETGSELQYRLRENDGYTLRDDAIPVPLGGSGQYVPFRVSASYPKPMGTGGTLEMYTIAGTKKNRKEMNLVTIPVSFAPAEAVELKVFFGNGERDPQTLACDVSYPVARRMALKTDDLMQDVLLELLQGPTPIEQGQRFFTSIPQGITPPSLSWDGDTLTVDFSPDLTKGVAGSCKVAAIRSQIERTLEQFPAVKNVVISVDGKSEDILQP